jgi:hypothetical protein
MAETGSIEQATAKLQGILSAVNDANVELEGMFEVLHARKELRAQTLDEISRHHESFSLQANQLCEQFRMLGEQQAAMHEAADTAFTSRANRLEMFASTLDNSDVLLKHTVGDAGSQAHSLVDTVCAASQEVVTSWRYASELMDTLRLTTNEATAQFADRLAKSNHKFQDGVVALDEQIGYAVQTMAEQISISEQHFGNFKNHITEDLATSRSIAFDELQHSISIAWAPLEQNGSALAAELCNCMAQTAGCFLETSTNSQSELQQAADKSSGESLSAAAEQVAASQQLLESVSECLQALKPVVEKLSVAEGVLDAFNTLVEQMAEE